MLPAERGVNLPCLCTHPACVSFNLCPNLSVAVAALFPRTGADAAAPPNSSGSSALSLDRRRNRWSLHPVPTATVEVEQAHDAQPPAWPRPPPPRARRDDGAGQRERIAARSGVRSGLELFSRPSAAACGFSAAPLRGHPGGVASHERSMAGRSGVNRPCRNRRFVCVAPCGSLPAVWSACSCACRSGVSRSVPFLDCLCLSACGSGVRGRLATCSQPSCHCGRVSLWLPRGSDSRLAASSSPARRFQVLRCGP